MKICSFDKCTGCAACYNACRHHAIDMKEDALGHLHPHIDDTKCVSCGLCKMSCPVVSEPTLIYPKECFAVCLPEPEDLHKSASGGAATIFMRNIVAVGGVVYGCTGEDMFNVRHVRVDDLPGIERLRGSKYVQSSIGETYREVMSDLKAGKEVLFTGTPCQVAGLKAFLRRDYPNLITADLVCHGVPSQKMLTENIHYYTEEHDGHKINVAFRRKIVGGDSKLNSARIEFGWFYKTSHTQSVSRKFYNDSYMFGFLQCLTFRDSCYTCRYATSARCSDITFADFWGLGDDAKFNKGAGVSLCLINSEKGKVLLDRTKHEISFVQRDVVEAIIGNGQLQRPSCKHAAHHKFRQLYPSVGLQRSIEICLKKEKFRLSVIAKVKKQIKRLLGKSLL